VSFLFKEAPAAVPTAGVLIFLYLLFASGAWFWFSLGIIGAVLLILGNLKWPSSSKRRRRAD
jgi:hypothetical protein